MHILDRDNDLLVGGGGWSYALNNIAPLPSSHVNVMSRPTVIKDSIAFQGRTPCGIPVIPKSAQCYKLKWYLVLKRDNTYRVLGTGFRAEGGRKGRWSTRSNNGHTVYQLYDENGKPFISLLKLDEGVLIFTDEKGNLLVGDLDFSYTLNRKF